MGTISTFGRTGRRLPTSGQHLLSIVMQSVGALAEGYLLWHERARQRRALAELGDHMLKDLGISRADAEAEAAKPFWRP